MSFRNVRETMVKGVTVVKGSMSRNSKPVSLRNHRINNSPGASPITCSVNLDFDFPLMVLFNKHFLPLCILGYGFFLVLLINSTDPVCDISLNLLHGETFSLFARMFYAL